MYQRDRAAASPPTQDGASMSAIQFRIRKIAMARRAVRELAEIAAQRTARARPETRRTGVKFRPLTISETEEIVGADLLAAVNPPTAASDR